MEPLRDRDRFAQFYLDYGLASIACAGGRTGFHAGIPVRAVEEMH